MPESPFTAGIVVGVDGSAESDAAVRWASREAALHQVSLRLVHVVNPLVTSWPMGPMQGNVTDWQQDNASHVLEQARKTVESCIAEPQFRDVHTEVLQSAVVPSLVDAAGQDQLIVVGNRGIGAVGRALLGSVSAGLVHHAQCPVAVVHADHLPPADSAAPVLLGIDGSPASEAAIAVAFEEASRRCVDLVALHAWSDVAVFPILGMDWREYEDQGREILGERLAGWQQEYPAVRVQRRIVCDQPAHWLIRESEHAQLVVVGSHGRGGFASMLLGSVSSAVAQSVRVPVIVVRGRHSSPQN